jgi:hypothetical protein
MALWTRGPRLAHAYDIAQQTFGPGFGAVPPTLLVVAIVLTVAMVVAVAVVALAYTQNRRIQLRAKERKLTQALRRPSAGPPTTANP